MTNLRPRRSIALTTMLTLVLIGGAVQNASASTIAVVGDVNAAVPNNFSFYDAILGTNQDVLFSRNNGQQNDIFNHYNSLPGVTATENAATLTAAVLTSTDMLVVTQNFNVSLNYTAAEITAVAGFVAGGGTMLMIAESSIQADLTGYNSFLSGIGSSIQYTGDRFGVFEGGIAAESTSLGALNPFDLNAYNTLSGGTAVYIAANGTGVAFETTDIVNNGIPEPITATLGLMGLGVLGMATRRRAA